MEINELLEHAVKALASDVFIVAGLPLSYKVNGTMVHDDSDKLMPNDTENIITEIYQLAGNRSMQILLDKGDDDFSFSITGLSRFRINAYRQRGSLSAVIRIVRFNLPDPRNLALGIIYCGLQTLTRVWFWLPDLREAENQPLLPA